MTRRRSLGTGDRSTLQLTPNRVMRGVTRTVLGDVLWAAVGDPIRRRILDLLLGVGFGTATSLSAQLPVTRQAVAKHLLALDRVGLVHGRKIKHERRYEVDVPQLSRVVAQLASTRDGWDARLGDRARLRTLPSRVDM